MYCVPYLNNYSHNFRKLIIKYIDTWEQVQAYLVFLCFVLLHFAETAYFTDWSETLHQSKDYNLLKDDD